MLQRCFNYMGKKDRKLHGISCKLALPECFIHGGRNVNQVCEGKIMDHELWRRQMVLCHRTSRCHYRTLSLLHPILHVLRPDSAWPQGASPQWVEESMEMEANTPPLLHHIPRAARLGRSDLGASRQAEEAGSWWRVE